MVASDEHALICDFAETYHVLDYKVLGARLAATLAAGLPYDSRIKRKLSGQTYDAVTLLLAAAVDRLTLLLWAKTKDGQKGRNRPASVLDEMTKEREQYMEYESVAAFEAARAKIMGG